MKSRQCFTDTRVGSDGAGRALCESNPSALALEIAPELRTSPLGEMISGLTPGGDRQQLVLNELAWRFHQDRKTAGLPPVEIPESTAPSIDEIDSMLCDP